MFEFRIVSLEPMPMFDQFDASLKFPFSTTFWLDIVVVPGVVTLDALHAASASLYDA
jgi:hypothetical protein